MADGRELQLLLMGGDPAQPECRRRSRSTLASQSIIKLDQRSIELGDRTHLVLYDLSSSYFEGSCCPLAKLGYSRDGRRGMLQVNCKRSANPILASPPVVF